MRWSRREYPVLYGSFHMDKFTAVDEVIKLHGADAVFEATAYGESGDFLPLRKLGLLVESMDESDNRLSSYRFSISRIK